MNQFEIKKNVWSKIILSSYAGAISEDTAVHTYIYQHIVLKEKDKKLSDELLKIAITEMKHLSILGNIIKNLGRTPKFIEYNHFNNEIYFNAENIFYSTNTESILKHNIELEKLSIKKYQESIKLINNKNIQDILKKIILEEEKHIKIFQSYL